MAQVTAMMEAQSPIDVMDHQGLVHLWAKRFSRNGQGYLYDDLVSAGQIGLLRARKRFNPKLSNKFSPWASWYIRVAMCNELGNTRFPVRVPRRVIHHKVVRKDNRGVDFLAATLVRGSDPYTEGVFGIESPSDPIGELEELEEQSFLMEEVIRVIRDLPEQQRFVFCSKWGLEGYSVSTSDQIAAILRLKRRRVNEIYGVALRSVRASLRSIPTRDSEV